MPPPLSLSRPPGLAPEARLILAFSGGADSSALLHLLAHAGIAPLAAVHVDHALQADSALWAHACGQSCAALGVPFECARVAVSPQHGEGVEAAAREARYAALAACMRPGDCLVTAHHRDDQAETVLLQLLRGGGTRAASGMPEGPVAFARGWLWRPLLSHPRSELLAYGRAHGLAVLEDPMNRDARFARAWLRERVMPVLHARYPRATDALARHARLAALDAAALDELALIDAGGSLAGTLAPSRLLALSPARARNLARAWLAGAGCEPPAASQLERLFAEVVGARVDRMPLLRLGGHEVRRYRDALYVMPVLPDPPARWQQQWSGQATLALPPGCGVLEAERAPPLPLRVRLSVGGERLRPAGSLHHRPLRLLFQESAVPPWVRRRAPLIELDGELAAVPGIAQDERFLRWCDAHAWDVRWRQAPAGAPH